jgi:hypothetical protein
MLKRKLTKVHFLKIFSTKKNLKVFLLLCLSILVQFSCNTTEPVDELKPGRRDYTWTVDTLKPPEGRSIPYSMWGANANDVWAVGLSYLNSYCIWHFDGNSWKNYTPDKYINPTCIWGTSNNNIWIGSSDGAFWHYDGIKWNKFSEIIIPNYQQFIIQSMYGSSPSNIYAVGLADSVDGSNYKGIITHYNGSKWELVSIPTIHTSFDQILYDETSDKFIITGWIINQADESIYTFNGTTLENVFNSQDGVSINRIGQNIYSVLKSKIYKYKNNYFELFLDLSVTSYAGTAYGRNEKDFFTINWDGIGHYNGTDLVTIYPKWNNDWFPNGAIVFEKDVFFIWDDSYNTFIVHGKLK